MTREGAGKRTYAPKHNGLRAKMLTFFTANPGSMLARSDIPVRFDVNEKSIQEAVNRLRRDGHIKTIYGPNRTTYYALTALDVKLPRARKKVKSERDWREHSIYVAPKPIPTSIFHYAEMV